MKNPQILTVNTFTCNYIQREDRLLLTINYEDIQHRVDFWVTRGFLLKLIPYLFDYTGENLQEEQSVLKNLKKTDNSIFDLTVKKAILLESVDLRQINNNIEIIFKSLKYKLFAKSLMKKQNFNSFVKLLTDSAPTYEWGITNII
jgi:hypothetical protein